MDIGVPEVAVKKIEFRSSADRTLQPALFYAPRAAAPAPLLVALHEWSHGYEHTSHQQYLAECVRRGWALVYPHFRGPNNRPEATGSALVIQDLRDVVVAAQQQAALDDRRFYLVGASGGGYTALLMAGRAPELWAGVSAWVPITDLQAWYYESLARGKPRYAQMVAASVGGEPAPGSPAARECQQRSPLFCLAQACNTPIDIQAGIHDGHQGSVPVSHALRAFNVLAAEEDRLRADQIQCITEQRRIPAELAAPIPDPLYGVKPVLFRRSSRKVRITIFEGGHEILPAPAHAWLADQIRAADSQVNTGSKVDRKTQGERPCRKRYKL